MRKWDDVTPEELLAYIEYLKHHFDPEIARNVIELFHERMQDDEHIDHDVLCYLMKHVFAQIMEGRSADQAFGLKPKRGDDKRKDTFDRDMAIATSFALKVRGIDDNKKKTTSDKAKGGHWEGAIIDTAEKFEVSESTVQRAYERFREALDLLDDDTLMEIDST